MIGRCPVCGAVHDSPARTVHDFCPFAQDRTVSPKSQPWRVAVRVLGGEYSALARKVGGAQSLEGLTMVELEELRRALVPYQRLVVEVEARVTRVEHRLRDVGRGGAT